MYSKKFTKFWNISTLLLFVITVDKSKVEIAQNYVAFSGYTNFTNLICLLSIELSVKKSKQNLALKTPYYHHTNSLPFI